MNHKFIGTDALDLMKFICKEFWEEAFRKKVTMIHCLRFNNLVSPLTLGVYFVC